MHRDTVNLARPLQLHAHVLRRAVEFLKVQPVRVLPAIDLSRPRVGHHQRRPNDQHAVPLAGEHLVGHVREHDHRLAQAHVDPQSATADPLDKEASSALIVVQ
ncbi:endonuclease [Clavibacter phage 33]|nr:endonuclease [Clavibacter phage 33]